MYQFSIQVNLIIQGCIVAIMIGLLYSMWIRPNLRLIGIGVLFITLSVFEKLLVTFTIITQSVNLALWQDILTLIGLVFLAAGFSRLNSGTKV